MCRKTSDFQLFIYYIENRFSTSLYIITQFSLSGCYFKSLSGCFFNPKQATGRNRTDDLLLTKESLCLAELQWHYYGTMLF